MIELKMLFKLLIYVYVMNFPSLFSISTALEYSLLGSVHAPEDTKDSSALRQKLAANCLSVGWGVKTLGTLPNLHAYRGKETYLPAN